MTTYNDSEYRSKDNGIFNDVEYSRSDNGFFNNYEGPETVTLHNSEYFNGNKPHVPETYKDSLTELPINPVYTNNEKLRINTDEDDNLVIRYTPRDYEVGDRVTFAFKYDKSSNSGSFVAFGNSRHIEGQIGKDFSNVFFRGVDNNDVSYVVDLLIHFGFINSDMFKIADKYTLKSIIEIESDVIRNGTPRIFVSIVLISLLLCTDELTTRKNYEKPVYLRSMTYRVCVHAMRKFNLRLYNISKFESFLRTVKDMMILSWKRAFIGINQKFDSYSRVITDRLDNKNDPEIISGCIFDLFNASEFSRVDKMNKIEVLDAEVIDPVMHPPKTELRKYHDSSCSAACMHTCAAVSASSIDCINNGVSGICNENSLITKCDE